MSPSGQVSTPEEFRCHNTQLRQRIGGFPAQRREGDGAERYAGDLVNERRVSRHSDSLLSDRIEGGSRPF
jgi:hypothetical protein